MGFIIEAVIKTRIYRPVALHVHVRSVHARTDMANDLFLMSIASPYRILYAPDDFFQPTSAPAPHRLPIIRNVNQFSEHTRRTVGHTMSEKEKRVHRNI